MQGDFMAIDTNEFEELKKRMVSLEKNVAKILTLLQGNELDKTDHGLSGLIKKYDERITKLEKWKDQVFYIIIGMGIPSSIGILKILEQIIK